MSLPVLDANENPLLAELVEEAIASASVLMPGMAFDRPESQRAIAAGRRLVMALAELGGECLYDGWHVTAAFTGNDGWWEITVLGDLNRPSPYRWLV